MAQKKYNYFFSLLFWLCLSYSQAQEYFVTKEIHLWNWNEFVQEAEKRWLVRFFYQADSLPELKLHLQSDSLPLGIFLEENLAPIGFNTVSDGKGNFFISKGKSINFSLPENLLNAQIAADSSINPVSVKQYLGVRNKRPLEKKQAGTAKQGAYEKTATISGYVLRTGNNEKIPGVILFVEGTKVAVTTDAKGYYELKLDKGNYILQVKHSEFNNKSYELSVYSSDALNFSLSEKVTTLSEVSIVSDASNKLQNPIMGMERLTTKSIRYMPKMMGESDLIKTSLLLPGVQSVGEGTAGFNVRGSPADQNIFYLNQIPVYNINHLLGLFTAFPNEAISNLSLYKSSFPTQFGGRISSIFDLTAKEADFKKFQLKAAISPVTVGVVAETPILKEKSSLLLGLRSTYSNWVLNFIQVEAIRNSRAGFSDMLFNYTHKLNPKNKVNTLFYFSHDNIKLASFTAYQYQNLGASVKWNHFIKEKHNWETALVYSGYNYAESNSSSEKLAYKLRYGIQHTEIKSSIQWALNERHHLLMGANSIFYRFDQGTYQPFNQQSLIIPMKLQQEQALENALFLNEEWTPISSFTLHAGLRYNLYYCLGPKQVYKYKSGAALEKGNITDTVYYFKNNIISSYGAPDVRVSLKYALNDRLAVKAAYNQTHQFTFMLSNTVALSPTDKWKLADNYIKPMEGKQASAGIFSTVLKKKMELSAEVYYKKITNLVEYKDGANLLVNPIPETDILQGNLKAYGVELMARKTVGKWNGWVSYTYARSIVQVPRNEVGEQINFGLPYPANYDKPHSFNLALNMNFSHRFIVSTNLVYATGRPITYPAAVYYLNSTPVLHYSLRNEFRIPDYFRIDLSANFEGNLKVRKKTHNSWSISVYNLLGRQNPYSIYFKQEGGLIKGYQLSVFGSPILSFTYNIKLGVYEN